MEPKVIFNRYPVNPAEPISSFALPYYIVKDSRRLTRPDSQ